MTEARPASGVGPARSDEIAGVARLAAECLREAFSAAAFAGSAAQPGGMLRVWRDVAGEVTGFLLAQAVLDELHLLSLAVAPAARRRGVAAALFAAALEESGARQVFLEVRRSNAAALGFYGSLGFEVAGTRRRYYPDGEDALLLLRSCGASAAVAGGPAQDAAAGGSS